jgi:hypothetical protein
MSISRPVVYVAGPYSQGDPAENVATAVHVATMLMDRGWAWPLVPHLTHLWHLIAPRPYRDWIDLDLAGERRAAERAWVLVCCRAGTSRPFSAPGGLAAR